MIQKIKKNIFKRKRFWYLVVFIIFLLAFSLSSTLNWGNNKYIGDIISIENNQIQILDRKKGNIIVDITEETQFNQGLSIEDLNIGTPIFITAYINENGKVEVKRLRILKNK